MILEKEKRCLYLQLIEESPMINIWQYIDTLFLCVSYYSKTVGSD